MLNCFVFLELSNIQKQILKEQTIESEEKRRYDEAQKLKEHYFGETHKKEIEASAHVKGQKVEILFKCPNMFGDEFTLPKDALEARIEDRLIENLNSEPVLTALTLLYTLNYKNEEKFEKCIEILKKLIDNIINNPNEEKYRKIRCENAQIKDKLLSCKYADLLLDTIGFNLIKVKKQDAVNDEDCESVYMFQHENELNYVKLKEFKESIDVVEPIKPVLDRNIQVFYITGDSQHQQGDASKFNLSDEFYNANIDDLKREQKLREEALEKSGMLRTKAMRERDEIIELRKYNYCLIRVKCVGNFYLQMLFKSNETLQELYNCVHSCLKNEFLEFDLASPLLKQQSKQQQNLYATFSELGLAPAAVLHFRATNQSVKEHELIKENLLLNVRTSFI